MKRREEMTFLERLYVFEVLRGLFITSSHLITNFVSIVLYSIGAREKPSIATFEYPDVRRDYPPRYRGRHRLTLHQDGRVRCTACFLCSTACPAHCIYIEPEEHIDPQIEKFPRRYEIDTLLCVYCGYCVEACPVDAIRMDTGLHPEIYEGGPESFIEDKETLMERSRILERIGHEKIYADHMRHMRSIEKRPFMQNNVEGSRKEVDGM